jgi:diaminopimelate epimerase
LKTLLLKVEGAGNDFLLGAGAWAERLADNAQTVVRLCRRHRGIGADGVLAVFPESRSAIRLVHRNADGSTSDFCANGTRCAARAAVERLGCDPRLVIHTGWTAIPADVRDNSVTLELPAPGPVSDVSLKTTEGLFRGRLLAVGVPHLVVPAEGLQSLDLTRVARPLRHHPDLGPDGANVHLVETVDDGGLAIRSLERGVEAEVLCCGSGVVAAALVSMAHTGRTRLFVVPRSGDMLHVEALGTPLESASRLTGPARLVAEITLLD